MSFYILKRLWYVFKTENTIREHYMTVLCTAWMKVYSTPRRQFTTGPPLASTLFNEIYYFNCSSSAVFIIWGCFVCVYVRLVIFGHGHAGTAQKSAKHHCAFILRIESFSVLLLLLHCASLCMYVWISLAYSRWNILYSSGKRILVLLNWIKSGDYGWCFICKRREEMLAAEG